MDIHTAGKTTDLLVFTLGRGVSGIRRCISCPFSDGEAPNALRWDHKGRWALPEVWNES